MATCYNGGTCQDRLETYVCECPTDWEGVHCHLVAGICKNRNCNTTHVCVAAAFERSQICVDEEKHLIQLSYDNTAGVPIETFQARLLDFILHHGRLPVLSNPNQRTRRQEQTIGEVQVFVVSAVEQGDRFVFEIVVLKNPSDVFTKDAVLTILAVTCRDISK
ncbi:hypothetical protein DPMN_071737 [Dreissena polymorpha]|uniref:EGF-like domain-containing protein n=1 Tax=Dreissena polymorpha TaxID=45954 RepID=A0A9D3Z7I9_DREPO|nr:hypothetical protein DPMN_071737 [Dreissena polymorpha]